MPATSTSQQKFFGMVRAVQKGELSPRKVSKKVRDTAKNMDPESVGHYAKTKHTDLPAHVKRANDIDTLLAPVNLNVPREEHNTRQSFSGIPSTDRAKTWDFALTEDGNKGRVLSFLVDNRTINFKLDQDGETKGIVADRIPDSEVDDFGVGGQAYRGRAQIHRSNPSSIYGTFQTGKNNITFSLENGGDDKRWKVVPKRGPHPDVKSFVGAILSKKAFVMPSWDQISRPLTGSYEEALPLSFLIGAGLMGAKNVGTKAVDKVTGNRVERPSFVRDVLTGGAAGAAGAGLFKLLGDQDSPIAGSNKGLNNFVDRDKLPETTQRFDDLKEKGLPTLVKKAFGNDEVNLMTLQSILGSDPTLNPADRRILLDQAQRAMRSNPGSEVSVSQLKSTGLGMLAGYAIAKLMGFGTMGTLASSAMGGMAGSSFASKSGPTWHSKGYTTY